MQRNSGFPIVLAGLLASLPGIPGQSFAQPASTQADKPLLIHHPTLSRTQIAFSFAGDIWSVPRQGGEAHRLTAGTGSKTSPFFSPDGKWIAFTGNYYGNADVFVMPSEGGEPRRITYWPGPDTTGGWSPDGKKILIVSSRTTATDPPKLFTVPFDGGPATELPFPMGSEGSFSPDAARIAYTPLIHWQEAWKRYRGGQTFYIAVGRLSDSGIEKLPRENSNDFNPIWVGNTVYFLSDRNGPVTLFAWDSGSRKVRECVRNTGLDLKSASAGPDAIVYEQFGSLHLYDLASGKEQEVHVTIPGQFSELLPHFEKLDAKRILHANISPTGARAVFEAHGEIVTVPASKGAIRNLTNSPAVADRDPAWSPDGTRVAFFSDESGEYALHIKDQNGLGEVTKINLGTPPSFFYTPRWSPDGTKIVYSDKRLNLWYVDIAKKTPVKIDTDYYTTPFRDLNPFWSPDSKWIAYTKQLRSFLHAVFVYNLDAAKAQQVTDGLSDARHAQWDKNGKYLYFSASTDIGLGADWLNMSSINRPVTRGVYAAVLNKTDPSPVAPESDEEKPKTKSGDKQPGASDPGKAEAAKTEPGKEDPVKIPDVHIDFEGLSQRIVALPVPVRNYDNVLAGKTGEIFLVESPPVGSLTDPDADKVTVSKFTLKDRKTEKLLDGLDEFIVSFDGEKALYRKGADWLIGGTAATPKPGEGSLKLGDFQVYVEPKAEWAQMYREVWRIERDFLYDPNAHGLNLKQAETFYSRYLDGLASRDDLNSLFTEMLGNLTLGHVFVGGGDKPEPVPVPGGLLGADYSVENNRYRFLKIYTGENWNPSAKAPLTQPGVDVRTGDYLIAVNGREVHGTDDVYSFFEATAGKQIVLRVGPNPDGTSSRDVSVVPEASERKLRYLDWIESNRRRVDQASAGRVAYVHLPDTAEGGYINFNRYFFSQIGKDAIIIDERYNHGGDLADYVIDYLRRPVMSLNTSREGADQMTPNAIPGPKVMIINQMAGSGGDALPWYFRKAGLGTLVGMRTWGGLVGILDFPPLIDGGRVTAPNVAIYGLNGEWEVENRGIAPDVEVDMDPKLVREGHDPQLEKAIEIALQQLKEHPVPVYKKPPYPDYHQQLPNESLRKD